MIDDVLIKLNEFYSFNGKVFNLDKYVEAYMCEYVGQGLSPLDGAYLFSNKDILETYRLKELDIDLINTEDNIIKMVIKHLSCYSYVDPAKKTRRVQMAYNKMRI